MLNKALLNVQWPQGKKTNRQSTLNVLYACRKLPGNCISVLPNCLDHMEIFIKSVEIWKALYIGPKAGPKGPVDMT